jgi:mono/diheme cytochrome c family protein
MIKAFHRILVVATLAGFITSCKEHCTQSGKVKEISQDSLVNRGKYLVTILGCGDCHSPKRMGSHGPEPDADRLFSGHPAQMPLGKIDTSTLKSWVLFNMTNTAVAGPWGISFASNITSDSTGIGAWTEKQFATALREGKSKGLTSNRMLLPPMPWPNYAQMSDEDLKAVFTYLKSTAPVNNVVPQPVSPDQLGKL